jgi:O-antigen/teichoic acid export membrane protein
MGLAPQIARDLYADDALAPVLLACGPLTLASAAYQWVEGAMQGLRRFGQLARGGAWVAGLDLVAGVLAAWWGVVAMLTVRSVVRSAATAIAVLGWFRGPESTHSEPRACDPNQPEPTRAKLARSLLQFAGPTFAGSVVVLAGSAVVRMLLVRGGDLVQAGHFQAADSLAQGLTLVPLAAAAAFMPASAAAADRPVREVAATFRRGLDQMTGYNLALCLTLLALAPWAMTFIFGNEFAPARDALIWLVCAYGAVGPGALFVAWLMGRGRPWTIFWVNVAWVAVSLSVFWWGLVPPTAAGAAIAVMIAQWATIGLYVLIVAPLSSLPRSAYGSAIPTTFVAIAAGATLQLLPGVPAIVGVGGNLILALLVFMRFSARDLASSHPVKQWFR